MIDFRITDDMDISFDPNGDLETVKTFETSIICGLFFEARDEDTTESFIFDKPNGARGHFGFVNGEGSLLWKLYQSRLSTNALNEARLFATGGLQFLEDDKIIKNLSVTATSDGRAIILNTEIIDAKNTEIKRTFKL